jgi:hypothetical protein
VTGRFLITGLPRSRTAWFAVATGALHEPISREGYEAFKPTWEADANLGVSDAGACFHLAEIMADFAPKTLIVDRPLYAVRQSAMNAFRGIEYDHEALISTLGRMAVALDFQHPNVKRVAYADLAREKVVESCLAHLGVSVRNLSQMMHMVVTSDVAWNMTVLARRTQRTTQMAGV